MDIRTKQIQDIEEAKRIFATAYTEFLTHMRPSDGTTDAQTKSFIESFIAERQPMKMEHAGFFLLAYPQGMGDAAKANLHFNKSSDEPDVSSSHNVALRRTVMKLVAYNDPNEEQIRSLKLDTARPTPRIVCKRLLTLFYNLYGSNHIKKNREDMEKMFLLSAKLAQQPYSAADWMHKDLDGMQNLFLLIWDIG